MPFQLTKKFKTPLLCWDIFSLKFNSLMEDAEKYNQSVTSIKQIAKINKWNKKQTLEAIENIQQHVIIITDHLQKIAFTGIGFQEMTGYSFEEAEGKNPNFLQGPVTNRQKTGVIKKQLNLNESTEMVLENYRRNGEVYLCKITIKPVFNIHRKLVNYIAYEQEIAA